jgi:hypothetical protein
MSMSLVWKRMVPVVCATTIALALATPTQAAAADTGISRTTIAVTWLGFVPCPTADQGELVQLRGTEQIIFRFTVDASGSGHSGSVAVYQAVSGVGLSSGSNYQAGLISLGTNSTNPSGPPPWAITDLLVQRFTGQAGAPNFTLWSVLHITVSPDFVVRAYIDQNMVTCG